MTPGRKAAHTRRVRSAEHKAALVRERRAAEARAALQHLSPSDRELVAQAIADFPSLTVAKVLAALRDVGVSQ